MTFSVAARCPKSGMFGVAVCSSSPAVAACESPAKDTVIFSPGSAHPQTEIGLLRWMTMLLEKMRWVLSVPAAMVGVHRAILSNINSEEIKRRLRITLSLYFAKIMVQRTVFVLHPRLGRKRAHASFRGGRLESRSSLQPPSCEGSYLAFDPPEGRVKSICAVHHRTLP